MQNTDTPETTDSWSLGKIFKYTLLPKPSGSPKAGKKEIIIRATAAIFFGTIAYLSFFKPALPSCDQSDTDSLVEKIVNDMPIVKASGTKFVSLKEVEEQGHNKKEGIRSCLGTLVTTAGEDSLQYSIKWQDKKAKTFYIEAQIVN